MRFSEIIGQHATKERLVQTVRENRISHAQLFLGPEGSGTLALALAYAQFINCTGRAADNTDSCGTCPSCRKYELLIHPDLHFIYPVATTREVDKKPVSKDFVRLWRELVLERKGYFNLPMWYKKIQVENKQGIINADDCNELIRILSYKAYEAEYKVMVIWMVEKLFHAAAPKLLKILEEPPDKTLFLLVSEESGQIITTILSRTQLEKIPRLGEEDLQQALINNYGYELKDARRATLLAEGNLIEALDHLSNPDSGEFFNLFRQWMRLCYTVKIEPLNEWISTASKMGRERQKGFFAFSLCGIRECFIYHYRPKELKLEGEDKEFVQRFSPRVTHKNINEFYSLLNQCIFHIERNANPTLVFMDTSLQVARLLRNP
ncbi:MAG: DNA polymerase III subunit delta [Bacteroidales bacterium]|nr:DNA polymerase III subunit delta [Bacteroidales bacterium]MDZ4205076.1 DNA polymerase III subunit delta [Bacteroidales bacterium]